MSVLSKKPWITGQALQAMLGLAIPFFFVASAFAQDAAAKRPSVDTGDTAWVLAATALVLLMTVPGLALFYGGLVRAKNVLNVLMQCFIAAGVIGVVWILMVVTTGPPAG